MASSPFVVLNLDSARFECTFGRGCEGICCRNGRPFLYPEEVSAIDRELPAILGRVHPAARTVIELNGYLTRRTKRRHATARVHRGWCIFFHDGCVLHGTGLKPAVCALFPLDRDRHDRWYVRQRSYQGEIWDLACLDPASTTCLASETLERELELARGSS